MKPFKAVLLARDPDTALASVANRPLLDHALGWLCGGGVREAAVVACAEVARAARPSVEGRGVELNWLVEVPGERFGESLAALAAFLDDEPFVLHQADSLARQGLAALLGDVEAEGLDTTVVVHGPPAQEDSVIDIGSRRRRASGGGARPWLGGSQAAGVVLVGPRVAAASTSLDAWPGRELNAVADRVTELGGRVSLRRATGWWRFRHGGDGLLEGNRFALEGLDATPIAAEIVDTDIQGAVSIHPTARIESSIVRGPVVIGAGVRLRDAYVGPYTSIGDDVLIEGAEVEHSIILPQASIRHLAGRLEASIVGRGARVFRDFRLPRALRLSVGSGAEVSLP